MEPSSQASSAPPAAPPKSAMVDPERSSLWQAELLDDWCERGILGLVLFILVFGPLGFGAVGTPQLLLIESLTVLAMMLWAVRGWLTRSYRLLWPPVCWGVVLFVVYAVARYRMVLAEGGVEYLARQELILVLTYAGLFFVIVNNLSRQESIQIASVTLFGLGTLLSLYALYQFLTKSGHVLWSQQYAGYIGRGSGTYICPNHLAGWLEMILPLALAFTLIGRSKPIGKVFMGYSALVIFAGIGVTLSRGAWVSTGLALLVFFGLLMKQHGQRLAAVIFLALLLGAFVFFVKNLAVLQRRINVALQENELQDPRFELWKPAIQMWRDHPWWGVGPGHFDERFRLYRPDDLQMRPLYAHNDYLNTLADWGAVGLGLIAATVGLLYWGILQSWKFLKRSNDLAAKRSNRSAFVLGGAVGLFAMLLHSVVDFNMHIPANAILAVALMAFVAGHFRFATERYWFKLGAIGKLALTAFCLVAAGYLALNGARQGREYVQLQAAERATELNVKVAALKAAAAAEPMNPNTTGELGETLRLASWQGVGNYQELATEAMAWFKRGIALNQFDPYNYFRCGMCLHWLDRHDEAAPFFEKAVALDPKNYKVLGHMGWHYLQLGNLPEARRWFEKAVFQAHWVPEYRLKKYEGIFYINWIDQQLKQPPAK